MGAPAVHAATELDTFDAGTLLRVLGQAGAGDFTARMPVDWTGLDGKIADGLNEILSANEAFATELERVSRIVGKEGRLSQRASCKGADRVWGDSIELVNSLIADLVRPSNEVQRVIGAVADGDLSRKVSDAVQGEMLELKNTVNGMVESVGLVLNTVSAMTVTERLLVEAQSQAQELESRQEQLRRSNEDLTRLATLLAERNSEIEAKYQEAEEAKRLVEEKATELSVSSKYKSEFIANMSHELRTPLNSLLVLAEQLKDNPDGNLTPRQVQYATVILTSGRDLLNLLNDILDLAKVESQTVHFELDEMLLTDLRDGLEQSFRPVADAQDLQFSVVLDDALPASLVTDRHRLRQVVTNLLSNAFKFTEQGEVSLRLSLARRGWNVGHEHLARAASVLAIDVQDTGIGIKTDLHAAIFEAFAQADGSTSRTYGGTGLGLSISRNLVNLLGGEITVASELGRGSTFTVYLPLGAGVPAADAPAYALTNGGALSEFISGTWTSDAFYDGAVAGTKVLIVDDDFRNIFALTALLERGGLEVVAAETGMSAIDSLREHPDISMVLMDIMMPEMDGYETMAAIRAYPAWAGLPMIAVTGKAEASERDRCLSAGASDYIPKPVDTAELLEALHQWFPVAATARAGPALRRDSSV
jgi:signal transduction histidine kinase/ActR/RegA family two-component response regulator